MKSFHKLKCLAFFSLVSLSIYLTILEKPQEVFHKFMATEFFSKKLLAAPSTSNNEWADLNQKIFFKKTTAIYFHDRQMFTLMFLSSKEASEHLSLFTFKFNFQISLKHDAMKTMHFKNIFYQHQSSTPNTKISFHLDLNASQITEMHRVDLLISLYLNDEFNDLAVLNEPIQVKIVENSIAQVKNMYICLEPSFMEPEDFSKLKWFLEMSSLIGYNKIVFNNNSIPNTARFNKLLLETYAHMVKINPYNYLPNIVKPELEQTYASHMEDLTRKGEEYSGPGILYHYLNDFCIDECLLTHRAEAGLIFFPDTDETFIPNKLKHFDYPYETFKFLSSMETNLREQDQVSAFNTKHLLQSNCMQANEGLSYIRSYLDDLYAKYKIHEDSSLFLPQVLFLTNRLMKEFFSRLELALNSTNSIDYPIRVKIYQKHIKSESRGFKFHSTEWDSNFSVIISTRVELNYAQNLLGLYRHLIEPFLKTHNVKLKSESERLSRYFYYDLRNDKFNKGYVGKSFVNPKTSPTMMGPHVPNHDEGFLYGTDKKDLYKRQPHHHKDLAYYYIAHFRDRYYLGAYAFPITQFHIDLNYFACYVRPLLL